MQHYYFLNFFKLKCKIRQMILIFDDFQVYASDLLEIFN